MSPVGLLAELSLLLDYPVKDPKSFYMAYIRSNISQTIYNI
jgi:hypothetical protein